MAQRNVIATLSPEVMTYYEKVFLDRAEYNLILKEGAQMRTHGQNSGADINFTRYEPLTISTTAIAEASNPSVSNITACTVSVSLCEYGLTVVASKTLSLVSIDQGLKEKIELVGQNMGETLNRLVRTELANGSSYFANGATSCDLATGDVLGASCIRGMTKNLEINKAMTYSDGTYIGKTNPYSKYTLIGDSVWINSKTYSDVKDLYKGEMGELYQVRWLNNIDAASAVGDASTAASLVVAWDTYVHGENAFGCFKLDGDKPKLYVIPADNIDSGNPAGRRTYITWAGTYATKILNSSWVLRGRFTAS